MFCFMGVVKKKKKVRSEVQRWLLRLPTGRRLIHTAAFNEHIRRYMQEQLWDTSTRKYTSSADDSVFMF